MAISYVGEQERVDTNVSSYSLTKSDVVEGNLMVAVLITSDEGNHSVTDDASWTKATNVLTANELNTDRTIKFYVYYKRYTGLNTRELAVTFSESISAVYGNILEFSGQGSITGTISDDSAYDSGGVGDLDIQTDVLDLVTADGICLGIGVYLNTSTGVTEPTLTFKTNTTADFTDIMSYFNSSFNGDSIKVAAAMKQITADQRIDLYQNDNELMGLIGMIIGNSNTGDGCMLGIAL
jgi:hypothetical protein